VIMPSFTFVATAHALAWQGVTPVFCDIDPATHNIDPARVEELITDETSAILGVHVWGRACDVAGLERVASRHGLILCFDAAHAFASSAAGHMIGGGGVAEAFSFHATKFFNTLEGGAITTNDDEVATRCRRMRDFGFAGADRVESLGINGKMNEASAAMGLTNLEALQTFIDANERNYRFYVSGLDGIAGLALVQYPRGEECNFQYVVIEVDESACALSRDELQTVLHAESVLARRYFFPGCHRMVPYRDQALRVPLDETDRLAGRTLALPTGTAMTAEDVASVCRIVRLAVSQAPVVRAAIAASTAADTAVAP
jgi:dTDP-4-amino-4,6-dideoxygalactose transaminase